MTLTQKIENVQIFPFVDFVWINFFPSSFFFLKAPQGAAIITGLLFSSEEQKRLACVSHKTAARMAVFCHFPMSVFKKVVHKASPVFLFWCFMKGSGDTVLR